MCDLSHQCGVVITHRPALGRFRLAVKAEVIAVPYSTDLIGDGLELGGVVPPVGSDDLRIAAAFIHTSTDVNLGEGQVPLAEITNGMEQLLVAGDGGDIDHRVRVDAQFYGALFRHRLLHMCLSDKPRQ